jgi:hypothetical protein
METAHQTTTSCGGQCPPYENSLRGQVGNLPHDSARSLSCGGQCPPYENSLRGQVGNLPHDSARSLSCGGQCPPYENSLRGQVGNLPHDSVRSLPRAEQVGEEEVVVGLDGQAGQQGGHVQRQKPPGCLVDHLDGKTQVEQVAEELLGLASR